MMTPDPITLEIIKKLTSLALDTGWKKAGQLIGKQIQQQVSKAVEQYVQNYEEQHCKLKFVCLQMDDAIRLEDVYTDVQVLERAELRYFEDIDALQGYYRKSGRGFEFDRAMRKNGVAVASQFPCLMVLGGPGIGKSTFLKKVGLEALKWETARFRHQLIPVFLELKQVDSHETQIEQLIAKEFKNSKFPDPEGFTQKALDQGKLLILLDGLDEVPTEFVNRVIMQIQDLVDRYDQNRFIASCRITAYKGGFPRFKDVTMAAFDDAQIETFICRWFHKEPKIADQCWKLLTSSDYQAAKELGQTPTANVALCSIRYTMNRSIS